MKRTTFKDKYKKRKKAAPEFSFRSLGIILGVFSIFIFIFISSSFVTFDETGEEKEFEGVLVGITQKSGYKTFTHFAVRLNDGGIAYIDADRVGAFYKNRKVLIKGKTGKFGGRVYSFVKFLE